MMFAKIGPCFMLNFPVDWSYTCVPTTSAGSRSGVNWIREKVVLIVSASVRTVSVFASPGTPSRSTCPPVSRLMSSRSTMYSWPTTRRPTCERTFCTSAASAAGETCVATSRAPFEGVADIACWPFPVQDRDRAKCVEVWLPVGLRHRADEPALARCEPSRLAGRERSELHRPEVRPHEALDAQAERFAEPADLAGASLDDGYLDLPPALAERRRLDQARSHQTILELDATPRRSDGVGGVALDRHAIGPLHLAARVRETVRCITIGRQEQHALGHEVEPADIDESRNRIHQIEDGRAVGAIAPTRQVASRLVEHDPLWLGRRADALAIDRNRVALRIDALTGSGHFAVHRHPSFRNHRLGVTPRCYPRARERALDAHGRRWLHGTGASARSARIGGSSLSTSASSRVGSSGWGEVRSAIASSSARGSSSRWRSANCSRNIGVVPYSSGRPSPAARPTTSIRPRSCSDLSTPPTATPRISSMSAREIGCR